MTSHNDTYIHRQSKTICGSKTLASSTNGLKIEARNCVEAEQRLETILTPEWKCFFATKNTFEAVNAHRYSSREFRVWLNKYGCRPTALR